eukprot:CAMPEP_0171133570 /NCGR_PEP_ID=MMETSP0766_2-20121228/126505_1 /TAXON_ID=439317 /ORGANISM="Gambierdiscus australes, Strain CAWD 149" /LENGTH=151 /DNA_ID=CAMNT_0011596965 /DNA_START=38 /DNA_END=490 /DNA_ORIENTATION=-
MRRTPALMEKKLNFAPFVAMDIGRCTAHGCSNIWHNYGYAPGCQRVYGPGNKYQYVDAVWYSLPGACSSKQVGHKDDACVLADPGGRCASRSLSQNCTWHLDSAGEIRLDELENLSSYSSFCAAGNLEYDKATDKGRGLDFWDDRSNSTAC